ncbi:citrate lyase acyl carrier protein [Vagococcus zengguangii]|uniref:Citrate lyase acyl carrier protein n=1 Tax=Vagococcus zengguangii TaxID=2571750 RepID=A0A4D7CNB8_9ENTE|nr:citrate lyase acyl carrier protein [Vagococcus zengguangii]QCI85588.1 citrate lyase acyl carrier protein [Vagococcus zengguangii]TLG79443.1 citrate lyase acyl carrier protein [Vagococcus zengguangii]
MEIKFSASAGTTESSDVLVMIAPHLDNKLEIKLESSVEKQFGRLIRKKIEEVFSKLEVTSAKVEVIDKGALDCTIEARTITAIYRAAGEEVNWEVLQTWND